MMRLVQNIFLPNAAMIAAQAINAFAERDLELVTLLTRSSLEQRAALSDGTADVAVTAFDNLFVWNGEGASAFRAVAQIERTTSLPVYGAEHVTSFAALAELDPVRVVVDSPASGFGLALVALVELHGIGRDRMTVVAAGGVNERLDALCQGRGDVALLAPFVAATAAAAGLHRLSSLEDAYPDYPGLVVALDLTRSTVEQQAVRAYLAALRAGRDWLAEHPQDGVAKLEASGLSAAAARQQLTLCGSGPLVVSRDGFAVLRQLRADQGLLADPSIGFEQLVTHRFIEED